MEARRQVITAMKGHTFEEKRLYDGQILCHCSCGHPYGVKPREISYAVALSKHREHVSGRRQMRKRRGRHTAGWN